MQGPLMPWKRSSQEVDCPWSPRKEILRVEVVSQKSHASIRKAKRHSMITSKPEREMLGSSEAFAP